MQELNFPPYEFRFKNSENKLLIFDPIRKTFVVLQPEEWVRQHVLQFLLQEKNYPLSHINVEKKLMVNHLVKRYDIVVFRPDGSIAVLVECKAPDQPITQEVFDQIARYNLGLKADFLMLTNGLEHYYCKMDYARNRYEFLNALPPHEIAG